MLFLISSRSTSPRSTRRSKDWTLAKFRPLNPGKKDKLVFDGNCKMAIKEFYKQIYAVDEATNSAIRAKAYAESLIFFRAFGAYGSASAIRKSF